MSLINAYKRGVRFSFVMIGFPYLLRLYLLSILVSTFDEFGYRFPIIVFRVLSHEVSPSWTSPASRMVCTLGWLLCWYGGGGPRLVR